MCILIFLPLADGFTSPVVEGGSFVVLGHSSFSVLIKKHDRRGISESKAVLGADLLSLHVSTEVRQQRQMDDDVLPDSVRKTEGTGSQFALFGPLKSRN